MYFSRHLTYTLKNLVNLCSSIHYVLHEFDCGRTRTSLCSRIWMRLFFAPLVVAVVQRFVDDNLLAPLCSSCCVCIHLLCSSFATTRLSVGTCIVWSGWSFHARSFTTTSLAIFLFRSALFHFVPATQNRCVHSRLLTCVKSVLVMINGTRPTHV